MKRNQMRLKRNLRAVNRCGPSAEACDGLGRGRGIVVGGGQSSAFCVLGGEGEINCPRPGVFPPHRPLKSEVPSSDFLGRDVCPHPRALLELVVCWWAAFRVSEMLCEGQLSLH